MKVSLIFFTSLFLVLPAHAQYKCSLSHKHSDENFSLISGERKEIQIGGWKITAAIRSEGHSVEVSLTRNVNVMDVTYQKSAKKIYSTKKRELPIELEHSFGGESDVFNMICYPQDPVNSNLRLLSLRKILCTSIAEMIQVK